MNKLTVLLLVLIAGAVGYLFGTEQGRAQRDQVIAKVRRTKGTSLADTTIDLTEGITEGVDATAEAVASTLP